ncbi:sialate O-acetylesterase [Aestuariibacter sp. A3R04]|uniref:sialate O-acetylesterase n=1 Tax=Aestuariibacter sp. A3R04 TaxID=2841571 RepID=UPI001C0834CD|nr:sialate O-acetylesterase [Aestuariibacter sp. A3R04]MBU3021804.1 sialate O-acetylesterase [Aestuariibacter sp. A3R04]
MKLILAIALSVFSTLTYSAEFLTFFFAGQSNMDGYGYTRDLPDGLNQQQNVWIFHGNGAFDNQPGAGIGIWEKVQPGHGAGFSYDGKQNILSDRFGPELSFSHAITRAYPNKKIAIIKYAVGGTGIALNTGYSNWHPAFYEGEGRNQYDFALRAIKNAFAARDVDGDGEEDVLTPAGIIWMQGEADAHTSPESANAYLDNLTNLMALFRAALRADDIPVVIGRITDSGLGEEDIMPFISRVHLAQQLFVERDVCAAYMTDTNNYKYLASDPWHYTSQGFISMGNDFFNAFDQLAKNCGSVFHQ